MLSGMHTPAEIRCMANTAWDTRPTAVTLWENIIYSILQTTSITVFMSIQKERRLAHGRHTPMVEHIKILQKRREKRHTPAFSFDVVCGVLRWL